MNPYDGLYKRDAIEKILLAKNVLVENSTSIREFTDVASEQFKSVFEYLWSTNKLNIFNYGFTLSEMLISCKYQGKECTAKDFYWYHDYNYGNCYRFNGGDPDQQMESHVFEAYQLKRATKRGWRNGLRLELYTGDQQAQQQYTYKTGVRVIVHNQSIIPFPDEDGIDVSVGTQTNIAISRTFMNRLAHPYSKCLKALNQRAAQRNDILSDMYKLITNNVIDVYQQNICLKLCEQKFVLKRCECVDLSLASLNLVNGSLGCLTTDQVNCLQEMSAEFYNSLIADECYSKCSHECDTITYETKISTADYPTEWYGQMFNQYQTLFNYTQVYFNNRSNYSGPNLALIKSTTAMVNIFYDTLTYTMVKESPALPFDILLANIGGNFGLFTGASMLSFVELVELAVSIIILFIGYKKIRTYRI